MLKRLGVVLPEFGYASGGVFPRSSSRTPVALRSPLPDGSFELVDRHAHFVVTILLAASRVARGSLHVTVGVRAEPHVFAGGRDRERADAREFVRIDGAHAMPIDVRESATRSLSPGVGIALIAAFPLRPLDPRMWQLAPRRAGSFWRVATVCVRRRANARAMNARQPGMF